MGEEPERLKKMRYFFALLICLFINSCMVENVIIHEAIIVDLTSENEIRLSSEEIANLNAMLKDGIEITTGKKSQVGNLIKAQSENGYTEIYLYDDGTLQFSYSNNYYKIKPNYIKIYKHLNRKF